MSVPLSPPLSAFVAAGAARARAAVERRMVAIEADWHAALPGAAVVRSGDEVSVTGVGLLRRWLGDARLRFAGGGAR